MQGFTHLDFLRRPEIVGLKLESLQTSGLELEDDGLLVLSRSSLRICIRLESENGFQSGRDCERCRRGISTRWARGIDQVLDYVCCRTCINFLCSQGISANLLPCPILFAHPRPQGRQSQTCCPHRSRPGWYIYHFQQIWLQTWLCISWNFP